MGKIIVYHVAKGSFFQDRHGFYQPADFDWPGHGDCGPACADGLVALTLVCTDKVLGAGLGHFLAKAEPDYAQAANAWERSIILAREAVQVPALGPEYGVASAPLFVLGGALDFYATRLLEQGAFAQAAPLIEKSYAVSVARGFRSGIGAALSNRGLQGNLGQARLHLMAAVPITTTNLFPAVHAKTKLCSASPCCIRIIRKRHGNC